MYVELISILSASACNASEPGHDAVQMIGHAGQAPNPGDYFTGTIADVNYVVVRGEDNQLRAFHNVGLRTSPGLSCLDHSSLQMLRMVHRLPVLQLCLLQLHHSLRGTPAGVSAQSCTCGGGQWLCGDV